MDAARPSIPSADAARLALYSSFLAAVIVSAAPSLEKRLLSWPPPTPPPLHQSLLPPSPPFRSRASSSFPSSLWRKTERRRPVMGKAGQAGEGALPTSAGRRPGRDRGGHRFRAGLPTTEENPFFKEKRTSPPTWTGGPEAPNPPTKCFPSVPRLARIHVVCHSTDHQTEAAPYLHVQFTLPHTSKVGIQAQWPQGTYRLSHPSVCGAGLRVSYAFTIPRADLIMRPYRGYDAPRALSDSRSCPDLARRQGRRHCQRCLHCGWCGRRPLSRQCRRVRRRSQRTAHTCFPVR